MHEQHEHTTGQHTHAHDEAHEQQDHDEHTSYDTHNHGDAHNHHHEHNEHTHDHTHDHEYAAGWWSKVQSAIPFLHGHTHGEMAVDSALETNARGIWALKISLLALGVTALFQVIIVLLSGSVALLADTIHNASDALTAVPLWIAFSLARRAATRRYTYGYGRAEDVAGVIIVLMIFASALLAGYESYQKLLHPEPLQNVWWVMAAAIVGFVGNEAVALLRIRVGNEIGSAALIADGQHAQVDGLTSLAVLLGALGSLFGFPLADPIIGLLITVAILFIVKDAAVTMWHRLMDAVDPSLVDAIEQTAKKVSGVQDTHAVRVRWIGHRLQAEVHIVVDEDLSVRQGHAVAEEVRHSLFHAQTRLSEVTVHVDPYEHDYNDAHRLTAHHTSLQS
jgi:cation diffusion facilitator family transporter